MTQGSTATSLRQDDKSGRVRKASSTSHAEEKQARGCSHNDDDDEDGVTTNLQHSLPYTRSSIPSKATQCGDNDDAIVTLEKSEVAGLDQDEELMQTTMNVTLSDTQFAIQDGGYGWVVVICSFLINAVTWGVNTTFGVYFSIYLKNHYHVGATPMRYAYIGGLSVAASNLASPLANLMITHTSNFKIPMMVGMVCITLGQCLAGICRTYLQVLFTQGLIFGFGLGFLMIPMQPLLSQWFKKKYSLATGIAAGGSGMGGLVLSNTTRWLVENKSLKYALICNGIVSLVVIAPCIALLKTTKEGRTRAKYKPLDIKWLWHPGYVFIVLFGAFAMMGYFVALYTMASYASTGLGLSQTQAGILQSILAAGQMIGRPFCGVILDWGGRHRSAVIIQILAGLTCFAFWLPAHSFGLLIVFALFQGLLGGTVWSSIAPLSAQVVGVRDLGSALGIFWLSMIAPGQFCQPIAIALIDYSQSHLNRKGANSYTISIIFCGLCFIASGLTLCASWRYVTKRETAEKLDLAQNQLASPKNDDDDSNSNPTQAATTTTVTSPTDKEPVLYSASPVETKA